MPFSHTQVAAACVVSIEIEPVTASVGGSGVTRRLNWLNEIELMSRVKQALVQSNCIAPDKIKLNGAGRTGAVGTKFDIEDGSPTGATHIEGVYLWSKSGASPGSPLEQDLAWLCTNPGRHVIAFVPPVQPGYTKQRTSAVFDIHGEPVAGTSADHLVWNQVFQFGALTQVQRSLFDGLVTSTLIGKYSICEKLTASRWKCALQCAPAGMQPTASINIERSVVGNPHSTLWAIVWSSV